MSSRTATETRTAILDAARALFEAEPYSAVGMEAVAKKAGVSRQAIYLHFASKADLLTALHRRINELDVEPVMRKVWKCPDAVRGLDAFVGASAQATPKILGIFNALSAAARVEPVAHATFEPPREGRYADCERMARWLADDGVLADGVTVPEAADVLFTVVSVPAYEMFVVTRGWSPRRWTTWTRRTLRTLLVR